MRTPSRRLILPLVLAPLLLGACTGTQGEVATPTPAVATGEEGQPPPAAPGTGAAAQTADGTTDRTGATTEPSDPVTERVVDVAGDGTVVVTGDQASFVMPSGNIQCVVRTDSVVCQLAAKDFTPEQQDMSPQVLGDCGPATADAVTLAAGTGAGWTCNAGTIRGQAALDLGGWWARDGVGTREVIDGVELAVLAYGQDLQVGSILCSSDTTGVACRDLTGGGGFTLARETYSLS